MPPPDAPAEPAVFPLPPPPYAHLRARLREQPATWLITGVAGFIGSNLLEALLALDQRVVGLDNFFAGHRRNLDEVRARVGAARWANFAFVEGDIRRPEDCRRACQGADYVLHHAAIGSVPYSLDEPAIANEVNVGGFVNVLDAARRAGVKGFVYAASSATYGDDEGLPKREERIGAPLSPYALTKAINEQYAEMFARCYGFGSVGLRYFNIFGPRQDPDGAYAAVIPRWTAEMLGGREVCINGDGLSSRDFCHVADAVQANLLAACAPSETGSASPAPARHRVFNIATGRATTLRELHAALQTALAGAGRAAPRQPAHRDFRAGDIRHSQADIGQAKEGLGFAPAYTLADGLAAAMPWYVAALGPGADAASTKARRPASACLGSSRA